MLSGVIATPFIHNLYILATIFFFQGISQGITDLGLFISKNKIILNIFIK